MKKTFGMIALALTAAFAGSALAQTHLRIGLAEDPDVLDPTLARTYVGRIVFSSICDKLFDIDEKLAIVPQLALSHETSADGKTMTIKLRPNVKFHDGEALTAEAAKYSLDRHLNMKGSFRKPEIASVESVEVVDPLTIKLNLKAPFSPLLAQLTDRAGMMFSPKAAEAAGDKFGLKPVCAGPYKFVERVQQDRIVVEKFADYWNKDQVFIDKITYLPIVDSTVRLANLRSGGLDLIERVLATDIKDVRADSRLAMPETIIGLFPDVGVLYELSRAPGELGTHLALTGGSVGAADAVLVGLADHAVGDVGEGVLPGQRGWIDECYAGDDALAIVRRLEDHPAAEARETATMLRQRCPFAVTVTLAALRRAATLPDVAAVLGQDLALAVPTVLRPDFSEGVRAQVVDKDRKPAWQPARLEDVDPAEVAALFRDLGK